MIDICFWLQLLVGAWWLAFDLGWLNVPLTTLEFVITFLGYPVAWLVLIFLILARFLRDEFAEAIWQRAAANLVNIMVVVPLILMLLAATFEQDLIIWAKTLEHFVPGEVYDQYPNGRAAASVHDHNVGGIAFNEMAGVGYLLILVAQLVPFLFAALFKWHRWRES